MELAVVVKGRRWLKVEIGGEGAEALHNWLEWLRRNDIQSGAVFRRLRIWAGPSGWRIGGGLSDNGVYKILGRRAKMAGVKDFHPHRFRHTFVTLAREAGWQDWQIAKVTGHRGAGAPMVEHYSHHRTGPLGAGFPRLG
ncbi:hypothetical protein LCGC14_2418240 [marine sediment metagenome]|uniref:Tyr recombinase domain-containing protein n=1 Tax=marine sediment metagenome TaxID=412755 RepID=A0A0F9BQJ5_9ZZZZ